jgi:hypothetical protein
VILYHVHQDSSGVMIINAFLTIGKLIKKEAYLKNSIINTFLKRFCDGDHDCKNGEDEITTICKNGNFSCPEEYFKCDSGRCINKNFVCDGGN